MNSKHLQKVSLVAGLVGSFFIACTGSTELADHPCPPNGTTLTYENFGAGFFSAYCTECHGGADSHSSRSFTSAQSIRDNRDRIFVNSAANNSAMPPGPDGPTKRERENLADWLACGAP